MDPSDEPIDVYGLSSGVASIAGGAHHSCAVTASGAALCWGDNRYGQLGTEDFNQHYQSHPVSVKSLTSGAASITAGDGHTCAITTSGAAKCWGSNAFGKLGSGVPNWNGWSVAPVAGLNSGVVAISAGANHTCAIVTGGGVKCWGHNLHGQLGDGTTTDRNAPVDVLGLSSGVVAIAAGGSHTCALTAIYSVKCWGRNSYGQLGDGTTTNRLTPVQVVGMTQNAVAIATSRDTNEWFDNSCAVKSTSEVACWGNNGAGVVGNGTYGDSWWTSPVLAGDFPIQQLGSRIVNISTRAKVSGGEGVAIGGLTIARGVHLFSSDPKTVAIIARGPSLGAYGISRPLPDPTLTLVRSSDGQTMATNDNWQDDPNAAQLQAAGLAPSSPQEAAIVTTLPQGAYTAIVNDATGASGVALVEVYEMSADDVRLINLSTRGNVAPGDDVMIGGFVIGGNGPRTVVVQGVGPSLSAYGIANALANPTLTLVRMSDRQIIASNDNWGSAENAQQLVANGLAPSHALDSAILINLDPGAYTAIVSSADGGAGVALVSVYDLNQYLLQ
jgi:hypothetical protein